MPCCLHGGHSVFGLLGGKATEGNKHGGIHDASVKEECVDDALQMSWILAPYWGSLWCGECCARIGGCWNL